MHRLKTTRVLWTQSSDVTKLEIKNVLQSSIEASLAACFALRTFRTCGLGLRPISNTQYTEMRGRKNTTIVKTD